MPRTKKTRWIKVTVAASGNLREGWGTNVEQAEIEIAADYKVDLPSDPGDWLEIESADGGIWAFPAHRVISVVTKGDG